MEKDDGSHRRDLPIALLVIVLPHENNCQVEFQVPRVLDRQSRSSAEKKRHVVARFVSADANENGSPSYTWTSRKLCARYGL